ncbi:MAG: hypothetical protein SNJ67_00115 [Chloracidobacterium sp.]|uniref:Uncharacterized protein n=1 Tax=Chloracidobacterium validum TaxID=2821543 RepID=A0ABX8B6T3_9BACT|nr:hypothetical protein [Chloracidobacterium validum]QUW02628.1 hypothetical protein J8C06_09810 [Chloracidobacterium validum]
MTTLPPPTLDVPQYWLAPVPDTSSGYRPAWFVECSLKFHSLRARIKHTDERRFLAWAARGEGPPDWESPPLDPSGLTDAQLWKSPPRDLPHRTQDYLLGAAVLTHHVEELVNWLSRREKLRLWFNQNFDAFSDVGESRESFVNRLAESAAESIEDELAALTARVNLKLLQVQAAAERKGLGQNLPEAKLNEILTDRRQEFFSSITRLEALFSSGERLIVAADDNQPLSGVISDPDLHETLLHIEADVRRQLNALCTRCLESAAACDAFEIGLQPSQITVLRKGVLWLPEPA